MQTKARQTGTLYKPPIVPHKAEITAYITVFQINKSQLEVRQGQVIGTMLAAVPTILFRREFPCAYVERLFPSHLYRLKIFLSLFCLISIASISDY
jgi:hypothetical protein